MCTSIPSSPPSQYNCNWHSSGLLNTLYHYYCYWRLVTVATACIPSCPCPVCSRSFKSSVEGLKYNACSSLFNFLSTGFCERLFSWLTGYLNSPRKDCTADVVLYLLIVIWHHCEQFNEIRNTFCTENGTDCNNNNNNFPPLIFNSCSWIAQIKKVTVALLPCPVFHVVLYAWEGCNWRTGHASGKWLFH